MRYAAILIALMLICPTAWALPSEEIKDCIGVDNTDDPLYQSRMPGCIVKYLDERDKDSDKVLKDLANDDMASR